MTSQASLVGRILDNYRIVAALGAGGMGEVYRARDERLHRDVALKTLPPAFCSDENKLRRFEQEARTLAALSDPNLLAIYDVGSYEGIPYLVSELLEGETLRQRLMSGPIPFHRVIDFSMQIVRGMMAAHEKRIVHRDLKPENIFITRDGRVKILDFGVAKLAELEQRADSANAPTLMTTSGVVMGTVGYMSPEQVRGQTLDHRSDIFSFGSILFEMLTGKRAFQGPTTADTISAVLKEEPQDVWQLNPNLPPAIAHIVRHCLEKRPEERFQATRDLLFDLGTLSGLTATSRTRAQQAAGESAVPRQLLWTVIALVLLAAAVAAGMFLGRRKEPPLPVYHQLTSRRGTVWSARFAGDSSTIVYGAAWGGGPIELFSARPESPESRPLGLQDADLLAVSPTGEMAVLLHPHEVVRFLNRGVLARVPLGGGAPREILEDVTQADWSPDGSQLAVVHHMGNQERLEFPIGRVLFETGGWITSARVSPKGDRVAFLEHPSQWDDRGWVSVVDSAGNKQRLSDEFSSEVGLAWSRDGNEVWFTATHSGEAYALYAAAPGGKQRLVARVPTDLMLHDIARDGSVLLSSDSASTPILALPPGQNTERDVSSLDDIGLFDMSDDGSVFLFQYYGEGSGTNYASYLGKTDGSPAVRLGDGAAVSLSPDGKWAVTILNVPRQTVLLPTGPGQTRTLVRKGIADDGDDSWVPDARHVVFTGRAPGRGPRCYLQSIDGGEPQPITGEGFSRPQISPDGQWLLAHSAAGPWVLIPMHGGQPREVRGLNADDVIVRWSKDSRGLFVYRSQRPVQIVQLDPMTGRRQILRTVEPSDPAGIVGSLRLFLSADGRSYVYSFERHLSQLYLVDGMTAQR